MVIVARNSEGQPISTPGILGGAAGAECGAERVRKLLFSVPLDAAFAGGGVFDISGALLGVVVRCSGSWTAITHQSVQALLEQQLGAPEITWHSFGVHTREPSDAERTFLRLPKQGLFVSEVRLGSNAANTGIRPGDLLIASGGEALDRPEDLLVLSDSIILWRNRRRLAIQMSPEFSLDESSSAPVLTSVKPGSRAHAAGLQPGDRMLTPRLLQSRRPGWLIYQRGDRYAGVLLP
jgi:S1-C subfamily serine protease